MPLTWGDIPYMDDIDAEDEDGELYELFNELTVYDIENIKGFELPGDKHGIEEFIFIIRNNGEYYLCETQGADYVKFSSNISKLGFINQYDRASKIVKIKELTRIQEENTRRE